MCAPLAVLSDGRRAIHCHVPRNSTTHVTAGVHIECSHSSPQIKVRRAQDILGEASIVSVCGQIFSMRMHLTINEYVLTIDESAGLDGGA